MNPLHCCDFQASTLKRHAQSSHSIEMTPYEGCVAPTSQFHPHMDTAVCAALDGWYARGLYSMPSANGGLQGCVPPGLVPVTTFFTHDGHLFGQSGYGSGSHTHYPGSMDVLHSVEARCMPAPPRSWQPFVTSFDTSIYGRAQASSDPDIDAVHSSYIGQQPYQLALGTAAAHQRQFALTPTETRTGPACIFPAQAMPTGFASKSHT